MGTILSQINNPDLPNPFQKDKNQEGAKIISASPVLSKYVKAETCYVEKLLDNNSISAQMVETINPNGVTMTPILREICSDFDMNPLKDLKEETGKQIEPDEPVITNDEQLIDIASEYLKDRPEYMYVISQIIYKINEK